MVFVSYKYKQTGGKDRVPKPDLKGCFIWFIAFVLITSTIAIIAFLIEK